MDRSQSHSRPQICKFFLQGHCKYGDDCLYKHENPRPRNQNKKRKIDEVGQPGPRKARKLSSEHTPGQQRRDPITPPRIHRARRLDPASRPEIDTAKVARIVLAFSAKEYTDMLTRRPSGVNLSGKPLPKLVGRESSTTSFFTEIESLLTLTEDAVPQGRVWPLIAVLAPPGFGKTTFLASLCALTGMRIGNTPEIPFILSDVSPPVAEAAWKKHFPIYISFNDRTQILSRVDLGLEQSERISLRILHALFAPSTSWEEFADDFAAKRKNSRSPFHKLPLSLSEVLTACLELISAHTDRSAIFLALDELMRLDQDPNLVNDALSDLGKALDNIPRGKFNAIMSTLSDSPALLQEGASGSGRPITWISLERVSVNEIARQFTDQDMQDLLDELDKKITPADLFDFFNDPDKSMSSLVGRRNARLLLTAIAACGGHLRSISQLHAKKDRVFTASSLVDWFKEISLKYQLNSRAIQQCVFAALKGDAVQLGDNLGDISAKNAIESNFFMNVANVKRAGEFKPVVSLFLLYRWAVETLHGAAATPVANPSGDHLRAAMLAKTIISIIKFADHFFWQHAEQFVAHIISIRSCVHFGSTMSLQEFFGGNQGIYSTNFREISVDVKLINYETLQSDNTCVTTLNSRGIGSNAHGTWRLCTFAPNNPGFDILIIVPYKKGSRIRHAAVAIEVKHSSERSNTVLTLDQIKRKHKLTKQQLEPLTANNHPEGLQIKRIFLFCFANRVVADVTPESLPHNTAVLDRCALSTIFSPSLSELPTLSLA